MDLFLKGKNAIVTGGGNGIGREICLELVKEGVNVIVADINKESISKVNKKIEQLGGNSKGFCLDVTNSKSVADMVKYSIEQFGDIDILINCAGTISIKDIKDLPEEEWDKIFNINTKGVFLCCKEVLPNMIKAQKGNIINIASQAGKTAFPHEVHYSASKGAVIVFTQGLAREVAKYNINVNSVCPGSIDTDLNKVVTNHTANLLGISAEEKRKRTIDVTPLGRKGTTKDIANVVVFLVSERASFMTGQSVNVTGGRELH